jgi:protein tyrosine phosphatase (PTP) superfamily phosphohydrolase (DUF442 family)
MSTQVNRGGISMIVIEGMDNSGKSTLGVHLAEYLGWQIQESEGPPRSDEEINQRVDRYTLLKQTVFVRHPVTSNAIYGQVREEGDPITFDRQIAFYERQPILVYCDAGTRGLESHIVKGHDTEKHLDDITQHYHRLLYLYRLWAAEKAHFIYRIGDDMELLIRMIHYAHAWRHSHS